VIVAMDAYLAPIDKAPDRERHVRSAGGADGHLHRSSTGTSAQRALELSRSVDAVAKRGGSGTLMACGAFEVRLERRTARGLKRRRGRRIGSQQLDVLDRHLHIWVGPCAGTILAVKIGADCRGPRRVERATDQDDIQFIVVQGLDAVRNGLHVGPTGSR